MPYTMRTSAKGTAHVENIYNQEDVLLINWTGERLTHALGGGGG